MRNDPPGWSEGEDGGASGWPDPALERAREEAEGVEVFEEPSAEEALLQEREEAQGIELFVDPDAVIPATALREGSPEHEALVGDQVGLERDADDANHGRADQESWE